MTSPAQMSKMHTKGASNTLCLELTSAKAWELNSSTQEIKTDDMGGSEFKTFILWLSSGGIQVSSHNNSGRTIFVNTPSLQMGRTP